MEHETIDSAIANLQKCCRELQSVGRPMKSDRIAQLRKAVELLTSLLQEVDPVIVQAESGLDELVDFTPEKASVFGKKMSAKDNLPKIKIGNEGIGIED